MGDAVPTASGVVVYWFRDAGNLGSPTGDGSDGPA
jgi:hypothetical protein